MGDNVNDNYDSDDEAAANKSWFESLYNSKDNDDEISKNLDTDEDSKELTSFNNTWIQNLIKNRNTVFDTNCNYEKIVNKHEKEIEWKESESENESDIENFKNKSPDKDTSQNFDSGFSDESTTPEKRQLSHLSGSFNANSGNDRQKTVQHATLNDKTAPIEKAKQSTINSSVVNSSDITNILKGNKEKKVWKESESENESDEDDIKEKWMTKKEKDQKRKKQLKKLQKQKEQFRVKKEDSNGSKSKSSNAVDKQYYFGNGLEAIDRRKELADNITSNVVDCGFEIVEAKESKERICTFCERGHKGNFVEHLNSAHKDEREVIELKGLITFSKDWKDRIECLEKRARFSFNITNLERDEGTIIIENYPSEECLKENSIPTYSIKDVKSFVPCPFCLGFYHKVDIPHHVKSICIVAKLDKNFTKMRNYVKEGQLLLPVKQKRFRENVSILTDEMADDEIGETVKKDYIILKLGEYMMEKYKNFRSNQHSFIRQRMRVAGRLMNFLQKKKLATCSPSIDSDIGGIKSIVCAEMYDDIKNAALEMGRDPDNPGNILVTVPLKVGHAINKIAETIKMTAMRNPDERESQKIIDRVSKFQFLMESDWVETISIKFHRLMAANKNDKDNSLPLTSDIRNLVEGVKHELEEIMAEIDEKPTKNNLRKLAECLLIRLIVFNMRRVGELSRMRIMDYNNAKEAKKIRDASEVFDSFTEFEKTMAKKMLLIRMRGKCGRHVACLVPKDAEEALETVIKYRELVGISPTNNMIFATPNSMTHLQGTNVLKKYAQQFCTKPERVTGTKLRKYIASSCQILDLGEEGKETLSNHLGHQLDVHTTFYRKHADLVEVAKVSQILCLAESGKLKDNRGRNLSNLDVAEQLFEAELAKNTFQQEKVEAIEEQTSDIEEIENDSDADIRIVNTNRSSNINSKRTNENSLNSNTPQSKRIKSEASMARPFVKSEADIKAASSLPISKKLSDGNGTSCKKEKLPSDVITLD